MVVEVIAEFSAFFFLAADDAGHQMGVFPQIITYFRQQGGVFREAFHQDIARAVESGFAIRHAFIGIDIVCRFGFRIVGRLIPQQIGQRFETGFNGDLPAGAAFRFVRQVEIFELGFAEGGVDGFFQRFAELALFADRFEDRRRRSSSSRRYPRRVSRLRSCVSSRPPVTSLR